MKKLIALSIMVALAIPSFAQDVEKSKKPSDANPEKVEHRADSEVWPSFFALAEYPASPDVIGLRITIPFSTKQENITGFDVGLWGRAQYFEGLQVNLLRNDVKDTCAGIQVGLYNSIGSGEMIGAQAGLWNEAGCIRGVQLGIVNTAGESQGFQVGIINRAEAAYGFQVGLVNVIRMADLQFCPIVNIGF